MSLDQILSDSGLVSRNRSISFVTEAEEQKEKQDKDTANAKEKELLVGDKSDSLMAAVNWRAGQETDGSAFVTEEEARKQAQDDRPLWEKIKEAKDNKQKEWELENLAHVPPKAMDEDDMEFFDDIEYKKKQAEEQRKAEEAVEISSFRDALSKKVVTKPKAIQAKPKEPEPAKPKPTKRRLLVVRGGKNKAAKTAQDAGAEPETNQPAPENKAEEPGGLGGLLGADYGSDSD